MAITFSCQCGKQIKVAEKFAGRRGKCPSCGDVVTIPQLEPDPAEDDGSFVYDALSPESDLQPVQHDPQAGTQGAASACNACGKPMSPQAVICTHCGFHKISHTYMKVAQGAEPDEKESKVALLNIAGFGLRWWKLAIVIVPIAVISYWYFTGPARDVLIIKSQAVNLIETINSGETREAFNLYTQQGDLSLGVQGKQSKSNPIPFINNDEHFSLGGRDEFFVICPDEDGDHVALQVGLKQGAIIDNERTSRYDSILEGSDFKLIPADGGPAIEARLLYNTFEGKAEIDISTADTSNHEALFPSKPATLDMTREFGSINGDAAWNDPQTRGKISFSASYATGDMPAPKGLYADGLIKRFNDAGDTATMRYEGGTLSIEWDADDEGWWSKKKFTRKTEVSPWHRYNFGLLFERPKNGGDFDITYCDKVVASVYFDPLPQPKPPAVSPVKRANSSAQPAAPSSNPLTYFKVLADARNQARGIVSASNLRQLGIGLQLYLEQNHGQWPDQLDQIKSVMSGYEQVMQNPRTKERIGFLYTKPEPGANPATTPVIHESWQGNPDPNGAVLYADGHIQ